MSVKGNHEIRSLFERIIDNSCLTELEFISLIYKKYSNATGNLLYNLHEFKAFIKKPSGEKSTIRRRAMIKIQRCLLTFILMSVIDALGAKDIELLAEITNNLKNVLSVQSDELYDKLREVLEGYIKEVF